MMVTKLSSSRGSITRFFISSRIVCVSLSNVDDTVRDRLSSACSTSFHLSLKLRWSMDAVLEGISPFRTCRMVSTSLCEIPEQKLVRKRQQNVISRTSDVTPFLALYWQGHSPLRPCGFCVEVWEYSKSHWDLLICVLLLVLPQQQFLWRRWKSWCRLLFRKVSKSGTPLQ